MYTQQNPHPDLKYIETKARRTAEGTLVKTVWFQCRKCKKYMHSLNHFGWACPNCTDEQEDQKQIITNALDY